MKKGFTLVELLGVIIILGVLALITFPIIDKSIKNSKEKALERTIDSIEEAAYNYSIINDLGYLTYYQKLTLEELKQAGFLEKEIINPVTNENMAGCVIYKWDDSKKLYEFKYDEECDTGYEITILDKAKELVYSNGTCKTDGSTYQYMDGCYIKGGISAKSQFITIMIALSAGTFNDDLMQTFFDSAGNFLSENFEQWAMEFFKLTEEDLKQYGVNTAFEYILLRTSYFNEKITAEEFFSKQPINNYVWYSGFLWQIMGINADGTVRLIMSENPTAIPLGDQNELWDESYVNDWLNNYFYPKLKDNNIISSQMWCSESTTNENSARTMCTSNLSTKEYKVGLMTIDEYNLSGGIISYLNTNQYQRTMTPSQDSSFFAIAPFGLPEISYNVYSFNIRPVINVDSSILIYEGDSMIDGSYDTELKPYILVEKNSDTNGKLSDNATIGEYVNFAGKKYRVVDKDSNGNTKLILDGYYEENGTKLNILYGSDNVFSVNSGIGQKLNTDVLEWLVPSNDTTNRNKLVTDYTWYQNDFNDGDNYKISLEEVNSTRSIKASVGLVRIGEFFSGFNFKLKDYDSNQYPNVYSFGYWLLTSNADNSKAWGITNFGALVDGNVSNSDSLLYIRPVIVIKSDVNIISGNGTWSNPYQI